jgi:hypothetical protein
MVPVPLKIIKILVQELSSAGADPERSLLEAAALDELEEAGDDDGEWEDLPPSLDLSSAAVRNDLMGFAEGTSSSFLSNARRQDDETQGYLIDFFKEVSSKNIANFEAVFGMLTDEEKDVLKTLFSHV